MSLRPGQVVSFETFRQAKERRTAPVLPYLAPTRPRVYEASAAIESPFRGVELTDREVEHRERMLRHLTCGARLVRRASRT
jgi:hypothetical protein